MHDQRREPVDLRRVQVVAAHEDLDALQGAFTLEAQRRAYFFLVLEGQLILMLASGKMQFIAHPQQEIL